MMDTLPVSKKNLSVVIMTTRPEHNDIYKTVALQFRHVDTVVVDGVDGHRDESTWRRHRDIINNAKGDVLLLCSDTCILTETWHNVRRKIDRFVSVLNAERPEWVLVNMAPIFLLPIWQTTMQTDLFYAAPCGNKCVLYRLDGIRAHTERCMSAHWKPPMYVDFWLGLPASSRLATWPPVATDPVDDVSVASDLVSVLCGTVVPVVLVAVFVVLCARVALLAKIRKRMATSALKDRVV